MLQCSVIIPHFNQALDLKKCLKALNLQRAEGIDYEIIVVDNGSTEKLHLEDGQIPIVKVQEPKNPYVCRNAGVLAAKGKTVAFLDAKCVPSEDWLREGLRSLEKYDVVGGRYNVLADMRLSSKVFPIMYLNNEKNVNKGYGLSGGNLFVRKEVFFTVGLFQTESKSGNDILFTKAAIEKGCQIGYAEKAEVTYPSKDYKALIGDIDKYGTGAALTEQKTFSSVLPYLFPMRLKTLKGAIRQRRYDFSILQMISMWFLVWRAKVAFAIGIIKGLIAMNTSEKPGS